MNTQELMKLADALGRANALGEGIEQARAALQSALESKDAEIERRKTQFASAEFAVSELKAEIERLKSALKYEQHRAERIGTHAEGCWAWGPAHYECAMREIERLKVFASLGESMYTMTTAAQTRCLGCAQQLQAVPSLWKKCMEDRDALQDKLDELSTQKQEPLCYGPRYGKSNYVVDVKYYTEAEFAAEWGRVPTKVGQVAATSTAPVVALPEGWKLVPVAFLQAFNDLAHNYSLTALAPDYYQGTEGDAFKSAFRRCGDDLAKVAEILTTTPAAPVVVKHKPLTDIEKLEMWKAATIELPSQENCYLRGIADAERAYNIGGQQPVNVMGWNEMYQKFAFLNGRPIGTYSVPELMAIEIKELRKALAAPAAPVVAQWLPMETAPKEGSPRILLATTLRVGVSSWGLCRPQHDGYRANGRLECWRTENKEKCFGGTPLGWMPLPPAPNGGQQ